MTTHPATFLLEDCTIFEGISLRITVEFGPADPDIGPAREGMSIEAVHLVRGKHVVAIPVDLFTQVELDRIEAACWEMREGEA